MFSEDKWFSKLCFSDKFMHFYACFSSWFVLYYLLPQYALVTFIVLACAIGLELIQIKFADGFSMRDLFADIMGIGTALLVYMKGINAVFGFGIVALAYITLERMHRR